MNAVPPPTAVNPTAEERNWGMFAHLSALSGLVIPFGNIIGPLVVWLVKREQSAFVADQGREALNFNITVLLAAIVAAILMLVLIGFVLLVVIGIYWLVVTIIAGIRASEGKTYRYPFALRLIN